MSDEFVSKSRVYFEGWLPGNVKRLRNESFAMVVGASNNDDESRMIDREQLIAMAKKLVREWNEMTNAAVDFRLENALEHPDDYLEVVCPDQLYIDPFPLMLRCTKCGVLDYHERFRKQADVIKQANRRIVERGGRKVIPCRRGCGGVMQQVPYVSIHRCGNLTPIDIPFASQRVAELGYRDHSGSFLQSYFFDVATGLQTDHSLQMQCPSCRGQYDRTAKQGRPIANPDCFHVHNLQYLCLKEETGRQVSRVTALYGADPHSQLANDVAEAVVSTLLGLNSSEALAIHLQDCLKGEGPDSSQIEAIIKELSKQRDALEAAKEALANLDDESRFIVIDNMHKSIDRLEQKLASASGRFSSVRNLFSQPGTISYLGVRRRAMEAALLPYDFQRERETVFEMAARELDTMRKDTLLQDMAMLSSRYGVTNITHYKEIRVVMASLGYTRELDTPTQESANPEYPPLKLMGYEDRYVPRLQGKTVIYALPASTEALQIHLDPCRVLQWCVDQAGWDDPGSDILNNKAAAHAHLLTHCPALSMEPAEVLSETKNAPLHQVAPFHLLHTISHCLLGTIKRHSGYDDKGVMEYLIPMDLSIVLYVTSVQNYTAGGLLTLFRHHLRQWFDDASNYAFNCVFDPICSDKGASCSGCVQIVIGCETFNHGLSRSYLHG
ncbi:MAG: hypothetical protein RBT75_04075, partial [Anaerolineae bacterium]|nr:hypothetical protein [Anaerolineae bacterium]